MAFTEHYVDFAGGNDSNDGLSPAQRKKTIENVLSTGDQAASGGSRINIKGTGNVIAAELDIITDWSNTNTITAANILVFQGYTATAGDGIQGDIDGAGSFSILTSASQDNVHFIDLHLTNVGNGPIVDLDNECSYINCEFSNTTGSTGTAVGIDNGTVIGCYFHNLGNIVLQITNGLVYRCRFIDEGSNRFHTNVVRSLGSAIILECIVALTQTDSPGITVGSNGAAMGCSVFNSAMGTATGIGAIDATTTCSTLNCLVEGFSGAGGVGIAQSSTDFGVLTDGNGVFNCTNPYTNTAFYGIQRDATVNEILTASPFKDAVNGDFSPVDTGNVKEGSRPDKIGLFT